MVGLVLPLHGVDMVNPNLNNPVGLVPLLHGVATVNPNPNNLVELVPQLHGVVTLNPHPNPVIHTAVIHKCRHMVGLVLRLHGVATKLVEVQDIIQMATTGQFGCGISKMMGPKRQAFCPRINMLKGNFDATNLNFL